MQSLHNWTGTLPVLLPLVAAHIVVTHLRALQLLAHAVGLCRLGHGLLKDAQCVLADEESHHALTVEPRVVARGAVVSVEAVVQPAEQVPGLLVTLPLVDPVVLRDVLGEVADVAHLLVHESARDLAHLIHIQVAAVDEAERELERLQVRLRERGVDCPQ